MSWLTKVALRTSSNIYGSLRHVSCGKSLFSGELISSKDISETDTLYANLKAAKTAASILDVVHCHHRQMNEKHSVQALKTIFSLQKEGKSSISIQKLINHPDFEKICRNLKRYSGAIEINDTIESLKVLTYVGVPGNSTIVQVLLQIIRKNINFLSIPQIVFVDFLLKSFESSPLLEALKIALPLVFEINVKIKMNFSNPVQMSECLQYAIVHNLSGETVDFILRSLENYQGEFDGGTARSIIISICHLPRDSRYEKLINRASTDLVIHIDNISIFKMEIILSKLAHKYTNSYKFYYQDVLFDTCANFIVDHNIGYKRAVAVLRNMARLHHFHKPLLDYLSTYLYENPSTEKDPVDIYSLAVFLILTDYRPVHWNHLKEWISSTKNLGTENRKEIIWLKFAAALCVLDIYKIDVLTRALQEEYVKHLLQKNYRSDYEHYFVIWQCLTTYKPDLVQLLPSDLDPKDIIKTGFRPQEFLLEGPLQIGLGGEQFVLTNLVSKLGVQIDHAIIFSNCSPVPFERTIEYVEDIKLENDSQQIVLIWTGSNYHYTINTKAMRATVAKTLSILEETLKCNVVPINLDSWKELNDFEKVPYLLQKIKEKLDLHINVLESVV